MAMLKAGSRPPWVGLGAGVWVQIASGSGYTFPLYSHSLKSVLGFSQQQLNMLGVANDIGENFGLLTGVICNKFPPWVLLSIGALACFLGYGVLWLSVSQTVQSLPYWLEKGRRGWRSVGEAMIEIARSSFWEDREVTAEPHVRTCDPEKSFKASFKEVLLSNSSEDRAPVRGEITEPCGNSFESIHIQIVIPNTRKSWSKVKMQIELAEKEWSLRRKRSSLEHVSGDSGANFSLRISRCVESTLCHSVDSVASGEDRAEPVYRKIRVEPASLSVQGVFNEADSALAALPVRLGCQTNSNFNSKAMDTTRPSGLEFNGPQQSLETGEEGITGFVDRSGAAKKVDLAQASPHQDPSIAGKSNSFPSIAQFHMDSTSVSHSRVKETASIAEDEDVDCNDDLLVVGDTFDTFEASESESDAQSHYNRVEDESVADPDEVFEVKETQWDEFEEKEAWAKNRLKNFGVIIGLAGPPSSLPPSHIVGKATDVFNVEARRSNRKNAGVNQKYQEEDKNSSSVVF